MALTGFWRLPSASSFITVYNRRAVVVQEVRHVEDALVSEEPRLGDLATFYLRRLLRRLAELGERLRRLAGIQPGLLEQVVVDEKLVDRAFPRVAVDLPLVGHVGLPALGPVRAHVFAHLGRGWVEDVARRKLRQPGAVREHEVGLRLRGDRREDLLPVVAAERRLLHRDASVLGREALDQVGDGIVLCGRRVAPEDQVHRALGRCGAGSG
jgi:hypothetical protein